MKTRFTFFCSRTTMTLLVMLLTTVSAWADDNGSCGTNVNYSYVDDTHTLTITGTGTMADYNSSSDRPWHSYRGNITSVVIEEGVTTIGKFAFKDCNNLSTATISASVTSIGIEAFNSCTGLSTVTFAANSQLESIGINAFGGCYGAGFTSIEIPASVTTIDNSAFLSCRNLATVTFAAGSQLATIGEQAFYNTAIASITIPASVTSIGGNPFGCCNNLPSIDVDASNNSFTSDGGVLFNIDKTTLIQYPAGKSGTAYTIPASVTTIDNSAFLSCRKLATVTFAAGSQLATIGEQAFYGTAIASITIPASVIDINDYVFSGCENLSKVYVLPTTPPELGASAFEGCDNLTAIVVPADAYSNYNNNWNSYKYKLKHGYTVTCSGTGTTFTSTNNGPLVQSNETVTLTITPAAGYIIGTVKYNDGTDHVITPVNDVYSFTMPAADVTVSATFIQISGTCGTSGHESEVTWDLTDTNGDGTYETLTISGTGAMADYTALDSQPWNSEANNITSVVIGSGVTSIGEQAFSGCRLTSITLPEGLKTIGAQAFYNNGTTIENVVIPESVTTIGANAFNNTNVSNFYINNIPSKIDLSASTPFQIASDTKIHVFTQMQNIFANATNWSNYAGHYVADIDIVHVESIKLDNASMIMKPYTSGKLNATINPDNARVKDVVFTSSNPEVITIVDASSGTFTTGNIQNNATITCTAADGSGQFATCTITVNNNFTPATSVTLNVTSKSLEVGQSLTLHANVSPSNATYKTVTWVSSDENVATVNNNGQVSAVALGNATITAISGDGAARATCNVSVILKGNCGTTGHVSDVTWSLTGDGVLTISGTGAMADYTALDSQPWNSEANNITSIVIGSGVTSIGNYAFQECTNLATVTVYAPSCTLGTDAFKNCPLTNIYVFSDRVDFYKSINQLSAYASAIEAIPDLTVNDAGGTLGKWTTYYNGLSNVKVADGTTIYKATYDNVNNNVTLTPVDGKIIKMGEAVLLKSDANIVLESANDSGTGDYTDNDLHGVDVRTATADIKTTLGDGTFYVLGNKNGNFGFHKYTGTNMPANKAFLLINGSGAALAPSIDLYIDNNATGIENVQSSKLNVQCDNAWYTLDGRKLNAQPTKKGLYIVNGKKVVIK